MVIRWFRHREPHHSGTPALHHSVCGLITVLLITDYFEACPTRCFGLRLRLAAFGGRYSAGVVSR
jgi:hypothetical protein